MVSRTQHAFDQFDEIWRRLSTNEQLHLLDLANRKGKAPAVINRLWASALALFL